MSVPAHPQPRLFYRAALQRYEDALILDKSKRTTGAIYLSGYSVGCVLKALILNILPASEHEECLQRFRTARAHEYDWLLEVYYEAGGPRIPYSVTTSFSRVYTWSTKLRYSPRAATRQETRAFLTAVQEIRTWADGRI